MAVSRRFKRSRRNLRRNTRKIRGGKRSRRNLRRNTRKTRGGGGITSSHQKFNDFPLVQSFVKNTLNMPTVAAAMGENCLSRDRHGNCKKKLM